MMSVRRSFRAQVSAGGVLALVMPVLAALQVLSAAPPARAQSWTPPTGARGWCTVAGVGQPEVCVGDPLQACEIQFQAYGVPTGAGPFLGYRDTQYTGAKSCEWLGPGTDPAGVYYRCASGYTQQPYLRCVQTGANFPQRRQCQANNGATPVVTTPGPIDVLTGNKWFEAEDYSTADGSLSLRRVYSSLGFAGNGEMFRLPLGLTNWRFDFQYELQITNALGGQGLVTVLTPDGQALMFDKLSSGAMVAYTAAPYNTPQTDYRLEFVGTWPADRYAVRNAVSTWRLTDDQDRVWDLQTSLDPDTGKYDIARPISMTTREGRSYTFAYGVDHELTSITDNFGKTIGFTWIMRDPSAGPTKPLAVSEALLPGGAKILYHYEESYPVAGVTLPDRLARVEWVNASSVEEDQTSYAYANATFPTFVTGILDRDNVTRWSVTYDGSGRATQSSGPGGADSYSVDYTTTAATNIVRTVTNPLGKQTVYNYARSTNGYYTRLTSVQGQASPHCPATAVSYTYGTDKFVSSTTDEEGRITTYVRDVLGRPTSITEAATTPSARTTTVGWNPTFNLPAQIARSGLTIDLGYDTSGRLTTRTLTDTTSITTPYATNGRQHVWTYDWSTTGLLESVDGPLGGTGDTVTYAYDAAGYLDSITDQVGLVTDVTALDPRGAPATIVDPNGTSTTFAYDIRGRVITITTDPGASQSQYQIEYDAGGNVAKVTLPRGGYLEYAWDAGNRLTRVENDRGQSVDLTPNAMGDPTQITVKDAAAVLTAEQAREYDELGRLIALVGANAETTSFGYDKVDNLTSVTDARNKVWGFTFDKLNRVIAATNPESQATEYGYDARDNLTLFEDGRNLQTARVVDGFGNIIQETSPDRGVLTYWYDEADRLTKRIDGDGSEVQFSYDDAGRRTSAAFPAASAENVTYTYDSVAGGNEGKGRLTGVADQSGSAAFTYDAQGRMTAEAKTIGSRTYAVGYDYDANGDVVGMTLPSGRTVTWTRASDGLVTGVTTKVNAGGTTQAIASSVAYRPFGGLESLTYGNGLTLTRTFDQNEWLGRIEVKDTGVTALDLTYGRDATGALTSVTDNGGTGRSATFTYTDSGRLATADGSWGEDDYGWDAAGNRTSLARTITGVTSTEAATIASTSNRITGVRDGGGALLRDLTYRTGGSLIEDDRGTPAYEYVYNARDRLVTAKLNGVTVGSYAYDAFGRRVSRETFGTGAISRHYVFDPDGHLLAEHDAATGAVVKEYVWIDDLPVAVIDSSGGSPVTLFIHAGQLNEPLAMTNAAKATVWNVRYEPFGRAQVFGTASAALDLRLPGQWLQDETGGLHQNGFRDYDPSLGRYVETDPLGIEAGQNVYAYVDGDVLNAIDPTGEYVPLAFAAVRIAAPVVSRFAIAAGAGAAIGAWAGSIHKSDANAGRYCPLPNHSHAGRENPDECQGIYDDDTQACNAITAQYGPKAGAVCHGNAAQRLGECIAGGPAAIRTPLLPGRSRA